MQSARKVKDIKLCGSYGRAATARVETLRLSKEKYFLLQTSQDGAIDSLCLFVADARPAKGLLGIQ